MLIRQSPQADETPENRSSLHRVRLVPTASFVRETNQVQSLFRVGRPGGIFN